MRSINISKGLDIPISGEITDLAITNYLTKKVAVLGKDYHDLKPTMLVKIGDQVKKGQKLLEDKKIVSIISDAGTPCISDPGSILINEIAKKKINYINNEKILYVEDSFRMPQRMGESLPMMKESLILEKDQIIFLFHLPLF